MPLSALDLNDGSRRYPHLPEPSCIRPVRPAAYVRTHGRNRLDRCCLRVIAVAALYFTWQQARSAQRQTELQQRMHEDAAQPYVWADLRPDAEHGFIISLVVRNEGPTVATDVRVSFDRPLPNKFADEWDELLIELASLAPSRQMVWWLKSGPDWFAGDEPKAFEVSIVCRGPFGPVRQKYRINTEDFGEEQPTKTGSLAAVTKSIDALTKVLKQRRSSAPRAPGAT